MNHAWRLPDYWYWIVPLLVLAVVVFCVAKWRKYLLGAASILSLVILLFLGIMWPVSWNTNHTAGFNWILFQSGSRIHQWSITWTTQHGGLLLKLQGATLEVTKKEAAEFFSRSFIYSAVEKQEHYPIMSKKISVTKSDFVQKTLGFQVCWAGEGVLPVTLGVYSITVPYWFTILLCLPVPAWWLKRFLRKRSRIKYGLCLKCGYELRGNTSDKCPECGTPVPPRKDAVAIDTAKPAT